MLTKFEKSSSIKLKNLKVDNLFQYFIKKAFEKIFLILLGGKCPREIFNSFFELFQALIALEKIESCHKC